jgi:hypothetical protein
MPQYYNVTIKATVNELEFEFQMKEIFDTIIKRFYGRKLTHKFEQLGTSEYAGVVRMTRSDGKLSND